MPVALVTSVNVTVSAARAGAIAMYAASAAAMPGTATGGRLRVMARCVARRRSFRRLDVERLRRDVAFRFRQDRVAARLCPHPVELRERLLLLRRVPQGPIRLGELITGDLVGRV